MLAPAQIAKIVRDELRHDFEKARIVTVDVLDRVTVDNETYLKIDVLFDGEQSDLDARKVAGAVRRVRPALIEAGEQGFPLLSFVSRRDREAA